jgi:hypothetical protein
MPPPTTPPLRQYPLPPTPRAPYPNSPPLLSPPRRPLSPAPLLPAAALYLAALSRRRLPSISPAPLGAPQTPSPPVLPVRSRGIQMQIWCAHDATRRWAQPSSSAGGTTMPTSMRRQGSPRPPARPPQVSVLSRRRRRPRVLSPVAAPNVSGNLERFVAVVTPSVLAQYPSKVRLVTLAL